MELAELERSLRETLRNGAIDTDEKRKKAIEIQKQAWDQTKQVRKVASDVGVGRSGEVEKELDDKVATVKSKEEEINRRRQEVQNRVLAQVTRVESEARRLDELRKELDALEDPTRKEVAELRRRIELVDREIRPLKAMCDRKEKELKDAVMLYNDKSAQKTELVGKLFEIVTESERIRMAKLEELNRHLQAFEAQTKG